MNKLLCGAACAVVFAGIATGASASAQDVGSPYLKFGVGYGGPGEQDVENVFGVSGSDGITEGEFEFRPLLAAGYDFVGPWRAEMDLVHRYNELGDVEGTPGLDADLNTVALMTNVLYDFSVDLPGPVDVAPYLGAGAGVAHTRFAVSGAPGAQNSDLDLAGQLLAGLGFDVTDRWSADLGYRYFVAGDNDVNISGVEQVLATPHSHDVFLSLSYTFGPRAASAAAAPAPRQEVAPQPPAPPPLAPAAAAAVAAPAVICDDVEFVVYFGWDSATLTPQARQVVANAAEEASECDITRVSIEGHTDRSGAASYNQQLSQRRANVVRSALIDQGVAASLISVASKGEGDTAKPTEDGVREPLNRRSEVLIEVE